MQKFSAPHIMHIWEVKLDIYIDDDFDLDKMANCGECFRARRIGNGGYVFITKNHVIKISPRGDGHFQADCTKEEWDGIWKEYFDLGLSYKNIRKSIPADDGFLNAAANAGRGIRILRQDPFEMVITFIISQRKSIPAISSCVEMLCERFGEPFYSGDGEKFYSFPRPEKLAAASIEELSDCKLGYRVPYVMDAASRILDGRLDLEEIKRLDDGALFEKLKEVKGIGDKVSNCICLFAYHRTAMAPVDTWISKAINEQYGGVNPFPNFGEHAGIMQQYIFFYYQALGGKQ